jgi:hypothetical protein
MEINMFKNKPVTLIIASGLMIFMIILAGVLPLFGGNRAFGINGARQFNRQGGVPGNLPQGFTPRANGNFNPGGDNQTQGNFQNNGTGNFPAMGTTALRLIQLLRFVQIGGGILIGILGILSIVGMMLVKKWGRTLAIITSVIVLIITISGMFRFAIGLTLIENLVKIALAIAIVVLSLLPKSRQVPVTATT